MYEPNTKRYQEMRYNRVGNSGLKLPALSLGLWHNFGDVDSFANGQAMARRAFDLGITHFDLANNYGPSAGSAEETFGRILEKDFKNHRDELIISTKAGYYMWEGPYGEWGSRKQLIASLDQSLKRMNLDYVDIFYSHRPDSETPFEETALALDQIVRQGKALYVGISNYSAEQTREITKILKELRTPFIIHQAAYNLYDRWVEDGLQEVLAEEKLGLIAFSPLAQGQLTDRYLNGIPAGSRASRTDSPFLDSGKVAQTIEKSKALNKIAAQRGQSLAEMAVAWLLKDDKVTSVLIGASRVSQIEDNVKALDNRTFSIEELTAIKEIISK